MKMIVCSAMTPDRSQVVGIDLRIPVFKAITTTLHKVSIKYMLGVICVIIFDLVKLVSFHASKNNRR